MAVRWNCDLSLRLDKDVADDIEWLYSTGLSLELFPTVRWCSWLSRPSHTCHVIWSREVSGSNPGRTTILGNYYVIICMSWLGYNQGWWRQREAKQPQLALCARSLPPFSLLRSVFRFFYHLLFVLACILRMASVDHKHDASTPLDEDAGQAVSVPDSGDTGEGGKLKMIIGLVKKCLGVKDIATMYAPSSLSPSLARSSSSLTMPCRLGVCLSQRPCSSRSRI